MRFWKPKATPAASATTDASVSSAPKPAVRDLFSNGLAAYAKVLNGRESLLLRELISTVRTNMQRIQQKQPERGAIEVLIIPNEAQDVINALELVKGISTYADIDHASKGELSDPAKRVLAVLVEKSMLVDLVNSGNCEVFAERRKFWEDIRTRIGETEPSQSPQWVAGLYATYFAAAGNGGDVRNWLDQLDESNVRDALEVLEFRGTALGQIGSAFKGGMFPPQFYSDGLRKWEPKVDVAIKSLGVERQAGATDRTFTVDQEELGDQVVTVIGERHPVASAGEGIRPDLGVPESFAKALEQITAITVATPTVGGISA